MKSELELLDEADRFHKQTQGKSDLQLLDEADALHKRQAESQHATTLGEDISNLGEGLWEGAKKLPKAAVETVKGVAQHPGQVAAGLIPGISSIADIPAMLVNLGINIPEYAAEKVTGKVIPENVKAKRFPYYGHKAGENIANKLAGEPKTETERMARIGGELGGAFLSPSQVTRKLGAGLTKVSSKAVGFSPEKYEIFKEAGINPTLPEVSNFKSIEQVQKGLEHLPFSAGKIEKTMVEREEKLHDMFTKLGEINRNKPIRQTGEIIKEGAKAYNKKAQEISSKLYDKAWKGINREAPVSMDNTSNAIVESLNAISPSARKRLAESSTGKELLKLQEDIINNGGAIPFGDLKSVYKKDIDKGVNMWQGVADVDQATLKQISNAIKQDMDSFVKEANPQAAKDLAKADKYWANFSERNRKIANKAINETDPTKIFEGIISDLKGGDIAPPRVILQRMNPTDKKTFSEIFLSELGRGAEGQFDPIKWGKEVNKMRPESLHVALGGLPSLQAKQVKDMAKAIDLMKPGQAQTSGMSYVLSALGTAFSPMTTVKGLSVARGLGEIFTNPKVTSAMYQASKTKTPLQLKNVLAKYPTILPRIGMQQEDNMKRLIEDAKSPALKHIMNIETDPNELKAFQRVLTNE